MLNDGDAFDLSAAQAHCDLENVGLSDGDGPRRVFTYENERDPLGRAKRDVINNAGGNG